MPQVSTKGGRVPREQEPFPSSHQPHKVEKKWDKDSIKEVGNFLARGGHGTTVTNELVNEVIETIDLVNRDTLEDAQTVLASTLVG